MFVCECVLASVFQLVYPCVPAWVIDWGERVEMGDEEGVD